MKKLIGIIFSFSFLLAQDPNNQTKLPSQTLPKEEKSGAFLGIETSFGRTKTQQEFDSHKSSVFSLMGGWFAGYQYYFNDHFGIKTIFNVHDGTPIIGKFLIQNQTIETSALPFWIGTEFEIAWDFWQSGHHTLGMLTGLGYNFEIYHSREIKINHAQYTLSKSFQHNFYPILGIHYFYKHHQIELTYRFSGIRNSPTQEDLIQGIQFKINYHFDNYANLSYAYRF